MGAFFFLLSRTIRLAGVVFVGRCPTPRHRRSPLDPVFGEQITVFQTNDPVTCAHTNTGFLLTSDFFLLSQSFFTKNRSTGFLSTNHFFLLALIAWFALSGCINQSGQCRSNRQCTNGFSCFRGLCLRSPNSAEPSPPDLSDASTSETSEIPLPETTLDGSSEIPQESASSEPSSTEHTSEPVHESSAEQTPSNLPWIRFFRADQAITITDQQRHPNGDLLVGGWLHGDQAELAGLSVTDAQANRRQAFLLRLSPTGAARWVKVWGAEGDEALTSIAIHPQAGIYLLGTYTSAVLTLGNHRLPKHKGVSSFLMRLNEDGDVLWARSAGGEGDVLASALAIGENDVFYVAGQFYGKDLLLFDGRLYSTPSPSVYQGADFLSQLDLNGRDRWTLAYGSATQGLLLPKIALAQTAASPPSHNLYITHRFYLTLPAPSIKSAGLRAMTDGQDPYVMHVRSDGHPVWADLFYAVSGDEIPQALCAASSGVFLAGTYRGELFSSEHLPLFSSPQDSGFIAHWDTQGKLQWTQQLTATTATSAVRLQSLAQTSQGIALLGDFQGDIQLPSAISPNHKAQSNRDIFLATLDPQGRWRSFRTLHGSHAQTAQGRLLAQPDGSFVLSGTTNSPTLVWADSRFPTPQNNPTQTVVFLLHTERLLP